MKKFIVLVESNLTEINWTESTKDFCGEKLWLISSYFFGISAFLQSFLIMVLSNKFYFSYFQQTLSLNVFLGETFKSLFCVSQHSQENTTTPNNVKKEKEKKIKNETQIVRVQAKIIIKRIKWKINRTDFLSFYFTQTILTWS